MSGSTSALNPLLTLDAHEAAKRIAAGRFSAVDLVSACLEHIAATDRELRAWQHIDRDYALTQARRMDDLRQRGAPLGPLHGIPVGVKDIVDTKALPTEYGTTFKAGHQPTADAAVVERLHAAGAIVLGKTVSTEFAFLHPAQTSNPHDHTRTPGGSSSGSAASVAASQVPLSIGSQTNGSTIRPAAFCGVYGFKPTRGLISRYRVLQTSHTLDQVGIFARSLKDVGIFADTLSGYDREDSASFLGTPPNMTVGVDTDPAMPPNFAWLDLPYNDRLSDASDEGFAELCECLGERIERIAAPSFVEDAIARHKVIHEYELCQHLQDDIDKHWDDLSESIRPAIERGRAHSTDEYRAALEAKRLAEQYFEQFFCDYDAILGPATTGEAPAKSSGTGDPIFCSLWTLCGLPALSIPALVGENGLPVGVQLIGSFNADHRLLSTANWLVEHLAAAALKD